MKKEVFRSIVVASLCGLSTCVNAAVSFAFTDTGPAVIDARTGAFFSLPSEQFTITNNTGDTWTDFHMTLVGFSDTGGAYPFMRFIDVGLDGTIYAGPGTAAFTDANGDPLGYNERLDIVGLTIANGADLSFTVDIFGGAAPEGLASFQISAAPSFDGVPVPAPEPASIALLAIGIAGMRFAARRRTGSGR